MVNIYVHTVMLTNNITIPVVSEGSWLLYVHICGMQCIHNKNGGTYSFSWFCSSLYTKNNGEDSVGCWTVASLILFLNATPLKLHFES